MNSDDPDFADQPDQTLFSPRIKGSEKKALTGLWIAAVLLPAIPLIFLWHSRMPFFMKPGIPNPIIGVVVLLGAIFLFRATWETIRVKRFGDPALDLTLVPVPLGGTVEGRIDLGSGMATAPDFNVKLQCIHRVLQQTGKNSHYVEKVLWAGEKSVSLLPGGLVPVSIPVPPDQQESCGAKTFDEVLWRLTVRAPFRGVPFLEKYEIPVQGRTSVSQKMADERTSHGPASPAVSGKKMFLSTLPFLIVGLAIFGWGLYLLSFGLADIAKAKASAGWPTVAGRVQESVPPPRNAVFVTPPASNFTYTYNVNGAAYLGHTIYPHLLWRTSGISKLLQGYPVNTPVTVSYSPSEPANSCLLPGLRPPACQRLIMAVLIVAVGFLFGSAGILAPKYGEMTGNTISYKKGSPASKIMGWTLLLVLALGFALWWVT